MEASKFRRVYTLCQQTGLIHFQHGQEGACLRASEVRPQLDRFLIKKCGGEEAMRADPVMKKWFLSDKHPALNYKMSIRGLGEPEKSTEIEAARESIRNCGRTKCSKDEGEVKVKRPIAKSYFGNMVQQNKNREELIREVESTYKETVFYRKGVLLTIVCFIDTLQQAIFDHLPAFFLLHNFGTRSDKGFGSFTVKECDGVEMKERPEVLLKKECPFPIYLVKPKPCCETLLLDYANDLYKLMKSGVNQRGDYFRAFIYQYMHQAKPPVGNEKAWLKQNEIAPAVGKPKNVDWHENKRQGKSNVTNYQYVRAVLGVGDTLRFMEPGNGTTEVSIKRIENGKTVERFRYASPVVFKIIDRKLFLLPFPVNPMILDQEFEFSSKEGKGILKTPATFDMNDFISCFAEYINSDCNPQKYNTNRKLDDAKSIQFRGTIEEV